MENWKVCFFVVETVLIVSFIVIRPEEGEQQKVLYLKMVPILIERLGFSMAKMVWFHFPILSHHHLGPNRVLNGSTR